jgi:riboflavin synthase
VFSGIVHSARPVVAVELSGDHGRIRIDLGEELCAGLEIGASVAVNGVCLTAAGLDGTVARFDVVAGTLERTNLGRLSAGSMVNIERSLVVGAENSGHDVSGHVDAAAVLARREDSAGNRCIHVAPPPEWMRYLFPHGFVALNGVSLTISDIDRDDGRFSVWLIPETLARTNLGAAREGDGLNLEVHRGVQVAVDTIERAVERFLATSLAEGKLDGPGLRAIVEALRR